MTRLIITLNRLPKNSKRVLEFLEYSIKQEVTQTEIGEQLGLNLQDVQYAVGCLRKLNLVNRRSALGGKMSATLLSVNADTVARSDIQGMIHNV